MTTRRIWVVVGSLTLATAACGGSDGLNSAPTTTAKPATTQAAAPATTEAAAPETTEAPATTAAPAVTEPTVKETVPPTTEAGSANGINTFADVQPAVVQIIAAGTFRDPEIGYQTSAGSGSGFIISADGYAVTNNHVVTGAASLEVYIGGELDDSFNAQVVGASECNDLALIKISEDDLPYLNWAADEPTVGQEVYVAGFPLGDPEYTLVRGIVAKADADGETPWSSIDGVIQHDAEAQPGNSGGPLVTEDGEVLGVHYASYNPGTGTTQKMAISGDLAEEVVADHLMNGDFESLGINGSAVDPAVSGGVTGIWVSAVKAGSPASDVGLKPGDIITALNGLPLGTDGTMKDYCDVIRTAGEGTPMSIQVLSWDDQAVYEGEINNPDRPLSAVATFGEEAAETSESYSYTTVVDDTGEVVVDLPSHWVTDGQPDGAKASIWAAPDLESFLNSWDTPGTKVTVFPADSPNTVEGLYDLLSATEFLAACTYVGPSDYDDGRFLGILGEWTDCGGSSTGYVMLVTVDPNSLRLVTMEFQYVTSADIDAATTAINSFNLTT